MEELMKMLSMAEDVIRGIIRDEIRKALEADRKKHKYLIRYTRKEAAEKLGISSTTLWSWTKQGKINAVNVGRTVMYTEEEIDRVLGGFEPIDVNKDLAIKTLVKYSRSPKTYIMLDENTHYYKIGMSSNPNYRERTLQSEKPTIKMLYVCERFVEKELHNKYEDKRVRGEWFDLSEKDLDDIIHKYGFKQI